MVFGTFAKGIPGRMCVGTFTNDSRGPYLVHFQSTVSDRFWSLYKRRAVGHPECDDKQTVDQPFGLWCTSNNVDHPNHGQRTVHNQRAVNKSGSTLYKLVSSGIWIQFPWDHVSEIAWLICNGISCTAFAFLNIKHCHCLLFKYNASGNGPILTKWSQTYLQQEK